VRSFRALHATLPKREYVLAKFLRRYSAAVSNKRDWGAHRHCIDTCSPLLSKGREGRYQGFCISLIDLPSEVVNCVENMNSFDRRECDHERSRNLLCPAVASISFPTRCHKENWRAQKSHRTTP